MLELDPAQEAVRGEAADLLLPGDELGDGLLQAGVAPLLDPVLGPHHQRPVQLALGGAGQVGDLLTSCDLLVTSPEGLPLYEPGEGGAGDGGPGLVVEHPQRRRVDNPD